jgi:Rod binding domain-containing protein
MSTTSTLFSGSSLELYNNSQLGQSVEKSSQDLTTREAFQDFVAGTFFQQMLKALRSTENELPYIGGGQAEKVFRSQLDQFVSEDLAKTHGAPLVDELYKSFAGNHHIDLSA